MVWEFVVGFLFLVAASYIGTTMALRGFFGREYADPRTAEADTSGDGGTGGESDDAAED
ncbi:hypothetical protein [Halostella litorea]|uniref:hypothetical protein n=1 Tax=Halostella litorea TaxID=2528831 RepID=UPI00192A3B4D|nr:hypothetical protein [Halostella litorea]